MSQDVIDALNARLAQQEAQRPFVCMARMVAASSSSVLLVASQGRAGQQCYVARAYALTDLARRGPVDVAEDFLRFAAGELAEAKAS